MLIFNGKVVDVVTGEVIGYRIIGSTSYTAVISKEKAKELQVLDFDIVDYLDLPIIEAVKGIGGTYGVLSMQSRYDDSLSDIPFENLGASVSLYWYVFERTNLCPVDNETAIKFASMSEKDLSIYE